MIEEVDGFEDMNIKCIGAVQIRLEDLEIDTSSLADSYSVGVGMAFTRWYPALGIKVDHLAQHLGIQFLLSPMIN